MAAKVPDQENLYAETLLDMPERYQVLQHFLDIDGDWEPNWENMTKNEREERIREIILDEFPEEREEVEKCIRELWEMADAIDETHQKCTLANLAASSTSASSGILSILGMSLAPFIAGGSLILTTAGLGLGAVAAATSLSANLYESASTSKETEKAQLLMDLYRKQFRMANCPDETNFDSEFPTNNKTLEKNNQNLAPQIASTAGTALCMYKTAKKINANIKAMKCAQPNTGLKGLAGRATEAGKAIWDKIRGAKQAEKAFAGTSFAMSKGARLLGAATAGAFVLFDAYSIAQDAKHLQEGAKAETAAEIREKARKLEEELQELIKLYEEVRRDHYLRHCQITLGYGRSPTVSFCDGQSHLLPTRPQQPTQINGAATTKPTRASSVGQHPMRQTLMGSPQGFTSVGGSGSLQPACQKQRFTAAGSTFSQRSWNWQDQQVQGVNFQGGPHLTDERAGRQYQGNRIIRSYIRQGQEGAGRNQEALRNKAFIDGRCHPGKPDTVEEVVFQRVTHTPTDRRREGNTESRELSGNTLSRGRQEPGRTRRPLDIKQSPMVDEKLRLARSVGHHPTQQTLMGSPLDFQSVVGSGSPQPASQQQRPIAASSIISWQSSKWQDNQVEGAVFQRVTLAPIDGKKDSNTGVRELSVCTSGRARKEQRGTRRPLDRKHSPVAQDYQVEGTVFQRGNHTPTDGSREGHLRAKELSECTSYRIRKRRERTRRPPDIKNSLVADDSKDN